MGTWTLQLFCAELAWQGAAPLQRGSPQQVTHGSSSRPAAETLLSGSTAPAWSGYKRLLLRPLFVGRDGGAGLRLRAAAPRETAATGLGIAAPARARLAPLRHRPHLHAYLASSSTAKAAAAALMRDLCISVFLCVPTVPVSALASHSLVPRARANRRRAGPRDSPAPFSRCAACQRPTRASQLYDSAERLKGRQRTRTSGRRQRQGACS